jgi:hypothetical protein
MNPFPPSEWQLQLGAAYQRVFKDVLQCRLPPTARIRPLTPPEKLIKINLASFPKTPMDLRLPSYISFDVKPDISLGTVWNAVIARLHPIPYPFTIKTMVETPKVLEEGSDESVALSLTHCDTNVLNLRLSIDVRDKKRSPRRM